MENTLLTFHEFVKTRERMTSNEYNKRYGFMLDDLNYADEIYVYADGGGHIDINTKESWLTEERFKKYCLTICNESDDDIKVLEKILYQDHYLNEHMDWKYPTEMELPKSEDRLQEFVNQFEDLMETSKVTIDGRRYISEWDVKGLCEDIGAKFNREEK